MDVAALCRMDHRAKCIAGRIEVEIAGVNQNQVGLFTRRQAADALL